MTLKTPFMQRDSGKKSRPALCVFLAVFMLLVALLTACSEKAEGGGQESHTPKIGTFEPKLEEIYFIPILHNLEENTMIEASRIAIEEVWEIDLSDSEVTCQWQEGEESHYLVTFVSDGNRAQYTAMIDESQKAIVKLDRVLDGELASVSTTNLVQYYKEAERLAGDKLLVKDLRAAGAYLLILPGGISQRSVVVAFPEAALYVELAADLTLLGYQFFDGAEELDTYLTQYAQPFG